MTDEALHSRVAAALGNQYALEGEIGRGGMSVVYRARDLRLNRPVAIKVLPPELAYDPAVRLRFTREAQTSAQLSHPHIVPIYDVGEKDGIAWLVMALVGGGNLATLLAREPRQPIGEVRRILCEIADALAYAHDRGVVHRDIKPDNILLERETGRAIVTDFGIARAMEAGTRLTNTGVAVGTPTYMSPEQAVGDREVDGRSDLYSLGVVGYQMLTGRLPFTAGNSMAMLLKHVSERPPAITDLRPDVPRPVREAIERAMVKAPEDRWPTASAMRDAIKSDATSAPWRGESRDNVRYVSPRPDAPRAERQAAAAVRADLRPVSSAPAPSSRDVRTPDPLRAPVARQAGMPLVMIQPHLAALTPEQRADLRLWSGHVELYDRIKAMRLYTLWTLTAVVGGMVGFVVGVEDVPPLVLTPLVSAYIVHRFWKRGTSLRASGLKLRRVLFSLRAKWVIPKPATAPTEAQLAKIAPREVLEGPFGPAIRRAVGERAAILELVAQLPKDEKAMLPDVVPTANALVERVAHLAQAVVRVDASVDLRQLEELDARIAGAERETQTPESQRGLGLLKRQRDTLADIAERRATLVRQVESAGLALVNLRLDLVKLRSSGLQSALSDVSSATREARALSREIGTMLEAAAEVRGL